MAAERLAGMARPERCELPTFWARYVDFEEFPTSQQSKTDGMRMPVPRRDAIRSQVIEVLEAQIKKETGNEEG